MRREIRDLRVNRFGIEWPGMTGQIQRPIAPLQDRFDGALGVHQPTTVKTRIVQRRHVLVFRLERDRIDPRKLLQQQLSPDASLRGDDQQCPFGRVPLDLTLAISLDQLRVVAEHPRPQTLQQRDTTMKVMDGHFHFARHLHCACARLFWGIAIGRAGLSPGLQFPFGAVADARDGEGFSARPHRGHCHLVLCQRASFVRTDDGGATECLDGWQTADDRLSSRHPRHADRQRDRHRRRQAFGNRGDRQGDRGHEHVDGRLPPQRANGEVDRGQSQDDVEQHLAQVCDPLGQRGLNVIRPGDQCGNSPHLGLIAGGDHQPSPLAGGDQRRGERQVRAISRHDFRGQQLEVFLDRYRFTRQRRFGDLQLPTTEQSQVGGHLVARLQQHQIARNDGGRIQSGLVAIADDNRLGHQRLTQGFDRLDRFAFLNETDDRVDEDDAENDRGICPLPQRERDDDGNQQNVNQRLMKLQ